MSVTLDQLSSIVKEVVEQTPVTDLHTHLFAPHFGELKLAGIDELLTYHYLIAETLRASRVAYDEFWKLSKAEQANFIWETLFIENSPYSEACRGVITVLNKMGMDLKTKNLQSYRDQLGDFNTSEYVDRIFELAGVQSAVMTNDPFDPTEQKIWLQHNQEDRRFHAALRIDVLLNDFETAVPHLQKLGYAVDQNLNENNLSEIRRFVRDWLDRMKALYVAVSLPDTFVYPEESVRSTLISKVILPVCQEKNVPFAMMIGVKRGVNPHLKSAGDGVGKADIQSVEKLCAAFPKNKFMVTMLSRENQHELTVVARKFPNLMIFGCWWFLNNPSLIEEITSMRFELLGASVIPQHSDARILEQLIYKWDHSRQIIAKVLTEKYADLIRAGWELQRADIKRDVEKLFSKNFWDFLEAKL